MLQTCCAAHVKNPTRLEVESDSEPRCNLTKVLQHVSNTKKLMRNLNETITSRKSGLYTVAIIAMLSKFSDHIEPEAPRYSYVRYDSSLFHCLVDGRYDQHAESPAYTGYLYRSYPTVIDPTSLGVMNQEHRRLDVENHMFVKRLENCKEQPPPHTDVDHVHA